MNEVFYRRKQLHGKLSELVRCQVLAEQGDMLRVLMQGQRNPQTINKKDAIPANKIGGLRQRATIVPRQYPASPYSLINMLPK